MKAKPSWMTMLADLINDHHADRMEFPHGIGHAVVISQDIYDDNTIDEWCLEHFDNWTWRWRLVSDGPDTWHALFEFSRQEDALFFRLVWT